MKLPFSTNKKLHILLPSGFILVWLINLTHGTDSNWPYTLWGLFSLLCLWEQPPETQKRSTQAAICLLSCFMSLVSIFRNLFLFQPVLSLLSLFNLAMSFAGGFFAGYWLLLWLLSPRKKELLRSFQTLAGTGFVFLWAALLSPTDSRYGVYVFCAVAGVLCACHNRDRRFTLAPRHHRTVCLFSGLFALATVLSNYSLFTPLLTLPALVSCLFSLLGGFFVGYHILAAMMARLPLEPGNEDRLHPCRVFFVTFVSISVIFAAYLFSTAYPGLLSQDSCSTVEQILGIQEYNNTMPYWHTVTVQPFLRLGHSLFGTVDAGIALFHSVQILFMAACFAAVITTLYQIGVPKYALVFIGFLYGCIPYNIVYSVSLWKDVPFGGAALLFVTGLYRLIRQVGKSRKLNYFLLIAGALGFSLWRTNGWYAFLATFVVMALLAGKKQKKLLIIMALVLVLCWVLINPVLDHLSVSETNLVEAFAIPMQQVARVVACERPLSEEQTKLLSDLFWLEEVANLYNPLSVDPIKFYTFRNENIPLVTENPLTYLGLYLQLGIQYPADYLKAWINETKGYWNGGYEYWVYITAPQQEDPNFFNRIFVSWFRFLNDTEAWKLFTSVGLYVWGMIGCCMVNSLKKREELLLSIPALVLIAGLWLGTPVFCEFRYAYPLMLTMPLVACVTIYKKRDTP